MQGAGALGGATAAMDLLEDPMGAPERAFAGAALGGMLGGAGLLKYMNPQQLRLQAQNPRFLQAQNPIYL